MVRNDTDKKHPGNIHAQDDIRRCLSHSYSYSFSYAFAPVSDRKLHELAL